MIGLFLLIHFRHIPVSWGDVSQALIYHQVRKYLLRLENVQLKYWRPQILLLTVNPRTSFEALRFANDMKKGGLYIVGRVLVGEMNRRTAKRQAELQKASVMNPPHPPLQTRSINQELNFKDRGGLFTTTPEGAAPTHTVDIHTDTDSTWAMSILAYFCLPVKCIPEHVSAKQGS